MFFEEFFLGLRSVASGKRLEAGRDASQSDSVLFVLRAVGSSGRLDGGCESQSLKIIHIYKER